MWFRNLFSSLKSERFRTAIRKARSGSSSAGALRLAVETLEDRCVPAATFSIGGATIVEGNAGTQNALVTVNLSQPHPNSITVNYTSADGTATAGSDYTAVSGRLTFAKNEMSKTILVPVLGDRVVEADEYFSVQLSNPTKGATIANGTAFVTIMDDEPRISIYGVSGAEGTFGTTAFTFNVNLSVAYDLPVTVAYATSDGAASAGADYKAALGTLTFAPGQTSQTVTVLVNGDRLAEPDENFFVNISTPNSYAANSYYSVAEGIIYDSSPRISIADVYNYGESTFTYTVSLSAAYDQAVTVNFTTLDGMMIAGVDYVAASGTLTFAPGVTTQTITIDVLNSTSTDTYFMIQLSGASSNALIATNVAYGYSNLSYYYGYDPYAGYGAYYGGFYAAW